MKLCIKPRREKGFALVVALSLMILLTILAVGLLSLSGVALRTTSQGAAMSSARANARMALMVALGELQTHAGADTRITATGAMVDTVTPSKEHLTGVWDSWKIDPNALPQEREYEKTGGKKDRFRKWLVSHPDPLETEELDFVSTAALPENERVTLLPELKNGNTTHEAVHAGLVPVKNRPGRPASGAYGYAVFDDGVKARIDTGYRPTTSVSLGDLAMTMGAGVRADVARIDGLEKIDWDAADLSQSNYRLHKAVTHSSGGLMLSTLGGDGRDGYRSLFHDVTTESVGVFADVASGGLKQDLNSILNADNLPDDFTGTSAGARVYNNHLEYSVANATTRTGQIEPSWEQIASFANIYKSTLQNRQGGPYLAMQAPTWQASGTTVLPPRPSSTPMLMPSLVKVQLFFSAMAVPLALNGSLTQKPTSNNAWTEPEGGLVGWASTAWDRGARYFIELCMSPCITIHNPYNVTLDVRDLGVELSNIPMSVQINRRLGSSESGWKPSRGQGVDMIDQQARPGDRKFLFNLCEDTTGNNRRFLLAPGEVRAFMPTVPPDASFRGNEYRSWFAASGGSINMNLAKGSRGRTIGFYFPRISGNELTGYETYPLGTTGRGSLEYLAPGDQVKFKLRPCIDRRHPVNDSTSRGKVKVTLTRAGSASTIYSVMHFDLGNARDQYLMTGLENAIGSGGEGVETDWIPANQIALTRGDTPLHEVPLQGEFALLTLAAKTTHGGSRSDNSEGVMQAKPLAFHSAIGQYSVADVENTGLEAYPYEAGIVKLDPGSGTGGDSFIETNLDGKSYAISGHTVQMGRPRATIYEIPTGPLVNFAQLNSANLASTNSTAGFTYPIGNSWAHPMIDSDAVRQPAPNSNSADSLDHSFLMNSLLFDKYYFSGIAPREGRFMSPLTTAALAESFVQTPDLCLIPDKRLVPYLPDGETAEEAIDALTLASDSDPAVPQARYGAAARQLMKGAFNVNSTSRKAWKAMLASLHAEDAKMFHSPEQTSQGTIKTLEPVAAGDARFSRFLLPNNDAPDTGSEAARVFQGPRDISDSELDELAGKIVEQVRLRGPFLSMAEFVNRRIGSSDFAMKGALQAAIDNTAINSDGTVLGQSGIVLNTTSGKYENPRAMQGRSDQGAAGYLTQSDLLGALGNAATVRSDTFTIRAYGEARDPSGKVIAKAWCEAVVQRVPEYVDSADGAQTPVDDLSSKANIAYGRKFVTRSFRWLSPRELDPVQS